MATKNKNQKRSNNGTNRKAAPKKSKKLDLAIVALIVVSVLLAILIYGKAGIIGIKLNEILGGMIGIIKYILPIIVFVISIKMARDENENTNSRLIQSLILLITFSILVSTFQINSNTLVIQNKDISTIAKDTYALGTQGKGGGILGAIIAVPLAKLLSPFGAIVLTIGVIIMLIVFIFGISIADIINNFADSSKERREEKRFRREERMEQEDQNITELNKREHESKNSKKKKSIDIDIDDKEKIDEQIKINFSGNILEDDIKGINKKETENPNLFKQEEEQKEDKTKQVLQLEHAMEIEDENYVYPPTTLLAKNTKKALKGGTKALTDTANKLQKTLYSFGVSAKVENVSVGPAITRYELKPAEGVRVNRIANLADDIALNLAAETIRIEAPIPGKQAVGIEIPNTEKEAVHLREVLESEEFEGNNSKLTVALGKDVAGQMQLADIAKMPHVLIAGSTGSGKSVCINTIITSIIYNSKPSEVKMVMIDPKVVELSVYNGIPHLLIPVVTDPKKAAGALAWAVQEMDDRYNKFAEKGVRDLKGYNNAIEKEQGTVKMPQIVIIVDELADLMMVASKDVEEAICRLAQKARAAGMHLVIATQRPSVDVITGLIKANIPSRIAFAVSSQIDSRTILDTVGAEKLLGKGDMLFFPSGAPKPVRVQGAFVSDGEVEKIVDFVKKNGTAVYSEDVLESIENSNKSDLVKEQEDDDEVDPFLMDAIEAVIAQGQASASFIQRKFKVGYARAGRIIDQMEERGIISGYQGSKPRELLITQDRWEELKMTTTEPSSEE